MNAERTHPREKGNGRRCNDDRSMHQVGTQYEIKDTAQTRFGTGNTHAGKPLPEGDLISDLYPHQASLRGGNVHA